MARVRCECANRTRVRVVCRHPPRALERQGAGKGQDPKHTSTERIDSCRRQLHGRDSPHKQAAAHGGGMPTPGAGGGGSPGGGGGVGEGPVGSNETSTSSKACTAVATVAGDARPPAPLVRAAFVLTCGEGSKALEGPDTQKKKQEEACRTCGSDN